MNALPYLPRSHPYGFNKTGEKSLGHPPNPRAHTHIKLASTKFLIAVKMDTKIYIFERHIAKKTLLTAKLSEPIGLLGRTLGVSPQTPLP